MKTAPLQFSTMMLTQDVSVAQLSESATCTYTVWPALTHKSLHKIITSVPTHRPQQRPKHV